MYFKGHDRQGNTLGGTLGSREGEGLFRKGGGVSHAAGDQQDESETSGGLRYSRLLNHSRLSSGH